MRLPQWGQGYHSWIARAATATNAARPALAEQGRLRQSLVDTLPAVATACTLAAVIALSMLYGLRANTWAVMSDELQVARLATSIVDELSLVPTIHGQYYGAHSQLYPLLLAPLYGILDPTQAAAAAHALNALLVASAGIPAFLLARSVAGSSSAGYVAALLTAVTPWLVLSSTLLTENAAYPAFVWSVLLCQRTIAHPSPGRDLAAFAGLLLAYGARTQLLVVAVALPLAVLLHEVGLALRRTGRLDLRSVRRGIARAIAGHPVFVVAYLGALVLSGALAVLGGLGRLVGNYAVPFEGDLVPPGFWRATVEHFDQVTLGVGVLPVVLAGSWLVTTMVLSDRREAYAFASLLATLVPLVTFQVTSFDLRFTPEQFIQDRYLAYLVPLFAVGCGAWLVQRERRRALLVSAAVTGVLVVALLRSSPREDTVIFWAAPGATFRPVLSSAASWIGMSEVLLLQCLAALVISAALVATWWRARAALVVAVIAVAFGGAQVVHAYVRYAGPSLIVGNVEPRTWIDDVVPAGRSVALVPDDVVGPTAWWEVELWNRRVTRALRVARATMPTPFPALDVTVDDDRGLLAGPNPSDYVVLSAGDIRFGLASARVAAEAHGLRLLRVDRPYRLSWASRHLTEDGWTTPRQPAIVRVFGDPGTGRRALSLTLAASSRSSRRVPFVLRAPGQSIGGTVDPGGARAPVEITVCVRAGSHVDIRLVTPHGTRLPDGRVVGLHLEAVVVSRPWPCEVF